MPVIISPKYAVGIRVANAAIDRVNVMITRNANQCDAFPVLAKNESKLGMTNAVNRAVSSSGFPCSPRMLRVENK